MTRAAVARADEVIQAHTSMVVPPDWFDRFVASLDQPDVPSAALGRAAKYARERHRHFRVIRVEKLGTQHVLDGFDCGNDDLNDWLVTSARTVTGHGTRTWLAFDVHSGELIGYFSVLPCSIARDELGRRGRGAPELIPG